MARPYTVRSEPLADRFAAKVKRDPCGCLIWTAGGGRYGKLGEGGMHGALRLAHHVAFFLVHGRWPVSLRHTCDTPRCVEVSHLVEGGQAANMADMVARGRQQRGSRHYKAKLTEADVFDIRWARGLGARSKDLADAYGVSASNITAVCGGRNWRSV